MRMDWDTLAPKPVRKRGFAVRTVKNGAVKIGGKTFRPDEQHIKYDGRLDGQRFAFGRFWTGHQYQPCVMLWGTEEEFRDGLDDALEQPYVVDGHLPWMWWRTEGREP